MRGLRPVNAAWKVPTILTDASPQIELVRHLWLDMSKRGLMAAYQSAYKMWDRSRRHSEDRQVSIKE
jgi:hypothetical protein